MNRIKITSIHVTLWILYVALIISAYGFNDGFLASSYETSVSYLIFISFFYLHAEWVLPFFYERKQFKKYAGMLFVLYAYCLGIKYFFAFVFDPWIFKEKSSIAGDPIAKFLIISTIQWLNFAAFSTGYWFLKTFFKNQRKEREKEKIELENVALRAKLNPHFLFNVLDSFRIEAAKVLPNLASSIGSLIFIIRSSIIEPDRNGMIPLKREIRAIQCYISIFKKRYPENNIRFSMQLFGERNYSILPHILREFVENALKYGDYKDVGHKINIILKVNNDSLYFRVSNKKRGNVSQVSSGMGLKNIKKHIEIGYPNRHRLEVKNTPEYFDVELFIEKLNVISGLSKKSEFYDEEY